MESNLVLTTYQKLLIATQVLAGLVSNPHIVEDAMQSPEWVKDLVDTSLELADTMLKAERRMP